jgi:hypothetical protein
VMDLTWLRTITPLPQIAGTWVVTPLILSTIVPIMLSADLSLVDKNSIQMGITLLCVRISVEVFISSSCSPFWGRTLWTQGISDFSGLAIDIRIWVS